MKYQTRVLTVLTVAAGAVVLMACGGEDAIVDPPATSFQVTVVVTDPTGAPVPGLAMSIAPDGPWYGEKEATAPVPAMAVERLYPPYPCPFNPGVILQVALDADRDVTLTVEDIAGGAVQQMVNESLIAGVHQVFWDGRDDNEERRPSGIYNAHLVLRDLLTDEVVLDQSQPMLLAILDPARKSVGTTDADGRIVLDDLQLFPYLIGVPDFPAMDESGEQIGTISLTAAMRFELLDETTGDRMRFFEDVTGSATLQFTWDPAP